MNNLPDDETACSDMTLYLLTDSYPDEIQSYITDQGGTTTLWSLTAEVDLDANLEYSATFCLPTYECSTLVVTDSGGDGLTGGNDGVSGGNLQVVWMSEIVWNSPDIGPSVTFELGPGC